MDECLNHIISSSMWMDGDAKESNVLLPISVLPYEDDKRNSPRSMISPNGSGGHLASEDTSPFVMGSKSHCAIDQGLISREAQLEIEGESCSGNSSINDILNVGLKAGNMELKYNATLSIEGPLNLGYTEQLPMVGDLTSSLPFSEAGNIGSNDSDESHYHRSFNDLQNPLPVPKLWPPTSYDNIASLSSVLEHDRLQEFVLQGGNLDNEMDILGNRYVSMENILQLDKLSASVSTKAKDGLQNHPLPSFTAGSSTSMTTNGLSSLPKTTLDAPAGGCNGTAKPRVRARRGQATDPHSIAERLRREKIAERMKNLQELVPNSNKTDKASMLDEIIEYVKFLQLQVKVLSMSRLGAAEAVIPLITDAQAEGSDSLSLSPSAGLGVDSSPSPDQIAFEQEVLKLMESNMTMAMQYLQTRGLCLMPIALASAISNGKTSLSSNTPEEKKKVSVAGGILCNSSSCSTLPGIETHQISRDGNTVAWKPNRKGTMINCCNAAIKQEEMKNTLPVSGELKPKT